MESSSETVALVTKGMDMKPKLAQVQVTEIVCCASEIHMVVCKGAVRLLKGLKKFCDVPRMYL